MRSKFTVFLFCCTFLSVGFAANAKVMPVDFDPARDRLIGSIISRLLPAQHYEHRPLNDALSKAAFDLYLRQLDPRKRFLLQNDVSRLQKESLKIDDNLLSGKILLPDKAQQILAPRIVQVQKLVDAIFVKGFDPNLEEYLETDYKKLHFVSSENELQNRWRKSLKMQVLDEYLGAVEKKNKELEKKGKQPIQTNGTLDGTIWQESLEKVHKRTSHYLHRLQKLTRQEQYNRFFDAVARAFDPHTNYMAPTSKQDFDIHMSGSLEGIGALLREDDGHIKVVRIIPGSAAEAQGQLQAEDTILAVSESDGEPVDISDMSIREAVSYIRGPKGTEVRLTVLRSDGSRPVIPIVRDVVKIEETYVKSALLHTKDGDAVGYIKIPGFYRDFSGEEQRNVTDDTRSELYKIKKKNIKGLILDLRNNGGGSLSDAVEVSGLFLPGGSVVQVKNSQGVIRVLNDEDPNVTYDGPMIVLVNQFSASASEILAAALQDYGRALIVGSAHTHGKGTVQALMDLNRYLPLLHFKKYEDLGALKVTIQKFYRVDGGSTQYKGVIPDVILPDMLDYLESGEQYMENSLPWDQVKNVPHTPWSGARWDVVSADKKSKEFVVKSKAFAKIEQESIKAKERSKQTRVADFLSGVLKERKELELARKEAKAAGLFNETDDADEGSSKDKKSLADQLAGDPYVDLTLYLLDDVSATHMLIAPGK
jgi:carboxyl-terminal processing protease